jgi:hypothetical protein
VSHTLKNHESNNLILAEQIPHILASISLLQLSLPYLILNVTIRIDIPNKDISDNQIKSYPFGNKSII